jgi:hypothetical protein
MTRKASTAAASAGGARESNMLTFENCQGYLKNGKLKADDGTVLAVNGRALSTPIGYLQNCEKLQAQLSRKKRSVIVD